VASRQQLEGMPVRTGTSSSSSAHRSSAGGGGHRLVVLANPGSGSSGGGAAPVPSSGDNNNHNNEATSAAAAAGARASCNEYLLSKLASTLTRCLQLLEISRNSKLLLEILEISGGI